METKTCTKCGEEKPATNEYFPKEKSCPLGLSSQCKECHKKRVSEYRKRNVEKIKEYTKKHYWEHREDIVGKQNEYKKRYYKEKYANNEEYKKRKKKYNEENKEKIAQYKRDWCARNKEKRKISYQRYHAKKRKLPNNLTLEQWNEIKQHFNNRCCYCGQAKKLEMEHFIPLSKGGEYTINNIVPSCKSCNSSKFNYDFFEWYPQKEFYSKERKEFILKYLGYKNNSQQLGLI